jgi:hypothetical protein
LEAAIVFLGRAVALHRQKRDLRMVCISTFQQLSDGKNGNSEWLDFALGIAIKGGAAENHQVIWVIFLDEHCSAVSWPAWLLPLDPFIYPPQILIRKDFLCIRVGNNQGAVFTAHG